MCIDIQKPVFIEELQHSIRVSAIARSIGGADRYAIMSAFAAAQLSKLTAPHRVFGEVRHPKTIRFGNTRAGEDLIGIVKIREGVEFKGPPLAGVEMVTLAEVGTPNVRYHTGESERQGRVISGNATVELEDVYTREPIVYSDVMIVENLGGASGRFGDPKQGGALIYTGAYGEEVVGMLVALSRGYGVVAPVKGLFKRLGLELVDSFDAGDALVTDADRRAELAATRSSFDAHIRISEEGRSMLVQSDPGIDYDDEAGVFLDADAATEAVERMLRAFDPGGLVA